MSHGHSGRVPKINTNGLMELDRLEAEFLGLERELQNFARSREAISAAGGDVSARYRSIEARRKDIRSELKRRPSRLFPGSSAVRARDGNVAPIGKLEIAPATFFHNPPNIGLGTSGYVQVSPAVEGPPDNFPGSGVPGFVQLDGSRPGEISYWAEVDTPPDTGLGHAWSRGWQYLIVFPPPAMNSRFTYSLRVDATIGTLWRAGGSAVAVVSASFGETPDILTNWEPVVDGSIGGLALFADLTQPGPRYNGWVGSIDGTGMTIQRSFMVEHGCFPAVAVAIGVTTFLAPNTELIFWPDTPGSSVTISTDGIVGRVAYHYEPQLVVAL